MKLIIDMDMVQTDIARRFKKILFEGTLIPSLFCGKLIRLVK